MFLIEDTISESVLDEFENYLFKLKQYYTENIDIFNLINEWESYWDKYICFEVNIFFFNLNILYHFLYFNNY